MTPEQKIIAIAEFEGYSRKECPAGEIEWIGPSPKLQCIGRFSPETVPSDIPPYLTSRDAICVAVAKLGNLEKGKFVDHLISLDSMSTDSLTFNMITATPAQLADALLLTLGYEI